MADDTSTGAPMGVENETFIYTREDIDLSGITKMVDTLRNFNSSQGGDIIDLSNLLDGIIDDNDPIELAKYLSFSQDGNYTTIHIDYNGDGNGSDQDIVLRGVQLQNKFGADTEDIIQGMLDSGNLVIDQS